MDDLKKKGPADRSKINMHEVWEVEYWTKELGVSKDELARLVKKVGNFRNRSSEGIRRAWIKAAPFVLA
jgi:hypothetical protein